MSDSANPTESASLEKAGAPGGFLQQQRAFASDGYIILRSVVSKEKLSLFHARLTEEFGEWRKTGRLFDGGGLLSGHLNCFPGEAARFVLEELKQAGVLGLMQKLFPTPPSATRIGCNLNLPKSVPQHYHMDGLFLESFLIANIAVVDTDLSNGAIDVIPGTHQRFYKYWEFAAGRVYRNSRRLLLKQGDVLVRSSTLWHRGMPNHSSTARPMLALTLGEKGVDVSDPFSVHDGQVRFEPNWFKPSALGRLRERTVVAVPITYSAYRFVRSLVGNKGYVAF